MTMSLTRTGPQSHGTRVSGLAAALVALALAAAETRVDPDRPVSDEASSSQPARAGAVAPDGFVVERAAAASRVAPSGKAWIKELANGDNAFVGILRMAPGASVPEHADPTEEYIYVMRGSGTLTMNGEEFDVGPDMLIYMPAGATVSFQNGDEEMVVLQVFAGPGPASKYEAWKPVEVR